MGIEDRDPLSQPQEKSPEESRKELFEHKEEFFNETIALTEGLSEEERNDVVSAILGNEGKRIQEKSKKALLLNIITSAAQRGLDTKQRDDVLRTIIKPVDYGEEK